MTYRRTWFSYVLWFLYTVLCVISISAAGKVWLQHFAGIGIISPQIIYGLFVIPAVALYWIIRVIAVGIRKRYVWKERAAQISTFVAFMMIVAFAVMIRITCLNYYVSYIETYGIDFVNIEVMNLEYYNMAILAEQGSVPPMDYGISYLYVRLLSVVLSFLGNKIVSAIFFQICLQIAGILLAYTVTRKMTGRLPACILLLYLAGSLTCLGMLFRFGPEWLFFDLYMIGMLIASAFVKSYCADKIPRLPTVICAVAVGALIGALTYLDLTGASLLVVILIAALGKKTESEGMVHYNYSKGMNTSVILCSVLSCALVWHGAMYAAAYAKGTYFLADITEQMLLCYRNTYPVGLMVGQMFPNNSDIYLIGFVIILASFLVFEFFRSGKMQNYMPWIVLALIVAPTPLAMFGEHGFVILSIYIWAVLAGLGVQNCILGGSTKVIHASIEKINAAAERVEETESMENNEVKTNYIENPLPLPKKHVPREMDYQYAVEEKDMKYDVEVSEQDDFDVK